MSRSRLVMIGTVVSIVAAFGVAPAAQAAEDYFLAFQTTAGSGPVVQGETLDAYFSTKKAVELISFDWEAENPTIPDSAGAGAGKAKLNPMTVEKRVDSASVPLFQHLTTGAHISSMELFVRKSGATGQGYLKYRFATVFVTNVDTSGDGDEMRERVTFEYGAVAQNYIQQTATGAAGTVFTTGWNGVTNTVCGYLSCDATQSLP